jgi:hypothetical protein
MVPQAFDDVHPNPLPTRVWLETVIHRLYAPASMPGTAAADPAPHCPTCTCATPHGFHGAFSHGTSALLDWAEVIEEDVRALRRCLEEVIDE